MSSGASSGQGPLTRLQERFTRSGFEGFSDEENIELLLSLVLTEQECKKQAKQCIEQFQNLGGFLAASRLELEQAGISSLSIFCMKLLHELPAEILKQKIIEQPVYKSPKEIFNYLCYSMRDLKKEIFKVIYLNNRNQIIDTADLFEGTLESIPIRPREIIEGAINHNATVLIFAHNHPAGDPTPSKSDKQLTRDLVFVGNILQIKVLDHIIIGGNRYFSFADEGMITRYEDNFLNLKIRSVFESKADYLQKLAVIFAPLVLEAALIGGAAVISS
jgi:DNA repair protein RadC